MWWCECKFLMWNRQLNFNELVLQFNKNVECSYLFSSFVFFFLGRLVSRFGGISVHLDLFVICDTL
jgi:hypothetical protein